MQKIKFLILSSLIIIITFFLSCEQTVENPELLYEKKLVILSYLIAGENPKIRINKTMPPLAKYEELNNSFIYDAEVTISTNNKSVKCKYNSETDSYYSNELNIIEGETYNLIAKYQGMTATATTTVPSFEIDSIYYKVEEYKNGNWTNYYMVKLYKKIHSKYKISYYSIVNEKIDDGYYSSNTNMLHYDPKSNNFAEVLSIQAFYNKNDVNNWLNTHKDTIFVYDEPMYNYYITKDVSNNSSDLFGMSGTNPNWNVKGDGIGLFIGRSAIKELSYKKASKIN